MKLRINEIQKYGSEMLHAVSDICEKHNLRWFMGYGSVLGAIRHSGPIPWDSDIDIYVPESDLQEFLNIMKKELPEKYWIDYRSDSKHPRAFPRIGLNGFETEVLHIDVFRLGGFPADPMKLKFYVLYSRLLYVTWKSKTLDLNFYYPDFKRRFVSKTVRFFTALIPLSYVIKLMDKIANKIPFDEAEIVASTLTTMSRNNMHDRSLFSESILVPYEDFYVRVPKNYEKYLKTQYGNWKEYPSEEEQKKGINQLYEVREINV